MVVYICSRYSAKTKEQFEKQMRITKEVSREVVLAGNEVIVPHLYYPTFLDDDSTQERLIGTQSAVKLLDVCDTLFVYIGLKVSSGMTTEIEVAKQKDMPIYYFRNMNGLKDLLKKLTPQNRATNEVSTSSETPIEKCEDCLHNNTKENIPFPIECGECSLFYSSGFGKR